MTGSAEEVRASVRERFARIAREPWDETPFPIGPESAIRLGYAADEVDSLPSATTESFAGVGNRLGLGALRPGERVLDMGCGSGVDCLLAARRVGPSGGVVGVDMVPEMLAKAGFARARFKGWTGYRTSSCTQGGLVTALKPGIRLPSAAPRDRRRVEK